MAAELLEGAGHSGRNRQDPTNPADGSVPARGLAPACAPSGPLVPVSASTLRELAQALRRKRRSLRAKRWLDIVGALTALAASAPLWVAAALLIRLTTGAPVIFRQTRVGYRSRPFVLYKFTTMRPSADPAWQAAHQAATGDGILLKTRRDPRITRVGAWLRVTSVDELPQLLNVLQGDMSLVGPRPLLPFMLAPHPGFARARALVRPGITGLWQVRDRQNHTSATAMMPHDLEYVRRLSLRLDLAILGRTVGAVLSRKGAC